MSAVTSNKENSHFKERDLYLKNGFKVDLIHSNKNGFALEISFIS